MKKLKATIHKFSGHWPQELGWENQRSRDYHASHVSSVSETWLIGKPEGAENFAMRYYKVGEEGFSRKEQHPYDHGILILHGQGLVHLGDSDHAISQGDVVYIPADMEHQLINTSQEPLGFLCIIPARREKNGAVVWADENIVFD